ncbi:centrosomal protein of 57 kDa isoform X4 [Puntigrus tetrazona]|uniref:centrosomal protein of 57 kDa isoform X4 n=1 Tax=Puntigrus tetrazona TaxID=1606681 RepID=UPI001C893F59|nr:centrosomal protein of 57 kDa isoform X4 [Puntigrus tetrazona]
MESSSKPSAGREKQPLRERLMSDRVSLSSYTEYPAGRPFINTPFTHRAVKAFPESSGAAILSALKNLQEKIRLLELERCEAQQKLQNVSRESTHSVHRDDDDTHTNHDLLSQLSAAEARCSRLEKQLEHMRKTVRNTESDRTAVLRRQVSLERLGSADQVDVQLKLQKLDLLEQEYHRLTETQSSAERKIRQLERKLQEEEHQRKLVQDKAAQLQTGLEANRLLIQSVSPRPRKPGRNHQKKLAAKSTASSHSVRANVQHVLHLMKQHHPQLCNERVLGHAPSTNHSAREASSSSSSSSSCGEELSELLLTLQDEFGHMSFEQQELAKQIQSCVSDRLRQDLEREMETLVKRMENKGEQIAKVRRHQAQMEKLRRRCGQQSDGGQLKVSVKLKDRPGERSRDSLRLLKDMRSLQTSLRCWEY